MRKERPPFKKCQRKDFENPPATLLKKILSVKKTKGILFFNSIIVHSPKFT
jgi:hypothetical protein